MRRTVDRLERRLLALAVFLAILAVPVAVFVGVSVQRASDATAEQQNAASFPATATLLRDAPANTPGSAFGTEPALGEWHTGRGTVRTGQVLAPVGASAGTTVTIWLDGAGNQVAAPLTVDQAYWRGVVTVVVLLITAFTLIAIGCLITHWALDRRRLAGWEADWRVVEPRWKAH